MPEPPPGGGAPDYDAIVQAASDEWNVDPLLIKAVMGQESQGNLRAVSKAGAQGLMQITPDTQRGLGITDPFDPVQNIFGGAKYLSQALDAEKSVDDALRYYHGGPRWRQSFGPESRGYVPAVAARYKALLGAQQPQQPTDPQASPAPSQAQPERAPLVVGDSLASPQGLGGSGVVGASPQAVRVAVNALPDQTVQGRDVVLSSGASNNAAQAALLHEQIQALKAKGAKSITVVGVGDRQDLSDAGVNKTLGDISERNGVRFVPIDPAALGPDRIHPTASGYKQLRTQLGLG